MVLHFTRVRVAHHEVELAQGQTTGADGQIAGQHLPAQQVRQERVVERFEVQAQTGVGQRVHEGGCLLRRGIPVLQTRVPVGRQPVGRHEGIRELPQRRRRAQPGQVAQGGRADHRSAPALAEK